MDQIASVQVYPLSIPRATPYLGPLEQGLRVNQHGYYVRPGNKTIYNVADQSVLVKVMAESGATGWGECWGVVGPEAVAAIINQIAEPLVTGRDPHDVVAIYEDLYNAMRVRGFHGGFYVDAIAALDIAIWDLRARLLGLPLHKLLGATRQTRIPAYVSGLPGTTLAERVELAKEWQSKGFNAVKFAAAVADQGELAEIRALRQALGPEARILADLHWRYTAQEAIKLITAMEAYDLYMAEAPCESEDTAGQAWVTRSVKTPVAIGEELRTPYEYRPRFVEHCMSVIQPEIAHMGVTAMWQVCQMAQTFHCRVIPHATIGIGIFQAASLQLTAALSIAPYHEYQHSIFDKNLKYITGNMRCEAGHFHLPEGPGLGVEPAPEVFEHVKRG